MSREAVASELNTPTKNSVGPLCRRQFRGWIGIRRRHKQEAKKFSGHAASGSAKKVAPTTLRHAAEFQNGWIPQNSTMSYKRRLLKLSSGNPTRAIPCHSDGLKLDDVESRRVHVRPIPEARQIDPNCKTRSIQKSANLRFSRSIEPEQSQCSWRSWCHSFCRRISSASTSCFSSFASPIPGRSSGKSMAAREFIDIHEFGKLEGPEADDNRVAGQPPASRMGSRSPTTNDGALIALHSAVQA